MPARRLSDVLLRHARVARLATADRAGAPHVIPICFAFDGRRIYSPIDEKPKRLAPQRLRRVRNILANPRVALVIDEYYENWRRLRYILVHGTAHVLSRGAEYTGAIALLRKKYPQYRKMKLEGRPILRILPKRLVSWAAAGYSLPPPGTRGR